ncbi:HDOD domain-containing protein [Azoarcus sp. L1K30]|uniref:serine/threonine protein kinase n=1 Tax=Azoarcus sp. L1K30 TaxID=2820277 RepID=UPI001B80F151|nr:serine/threonine protein kinase [Azoarcus sp. L1K30]MBR0565164.1 HDOD domain-containing protein [Azoarcus sp. L1K30]
MTNAIGRFELRRELGRGAQSVVFLAFDPQLEREVAVKTLHFSDRRSAQGEALLAEARSVSRLRHPGIVPVFEAGESGGDPYLVFEYVPGESLAQLMHREGRIEAGRAAELMVQILQAVAAAHSEGVIHRDLKPGNVLLDVDGTPRVMDFGIARRVEGAGAAAGAFSGTPAYMAPEYVLKREVSARGDVYAAGVILIEMLLGRRLFSGNDVDAVMRRVVTETIDIPADAGIDERLSGIALRAVARDPEMRYQSALEFLQALEAWMAPAAELAPGEANQSTVDFLLRRMRHKSDFPALSESVGAINRIANSESESVTKLSSMILRDFSLTNKLLRLVNSVYYRQAGAGNISTISRAIVVLGFDAVRNIAVTVLLFEHLQNKKNAGQLKEEFLRANLAALLARDLAGRMTFRDLEQAYICSIFHGLGRLLSQFYFPEECDEIRRLVGQKACGEEAAVHRVLGLSYEDLGVGIARSWGFPSVIVNSMHRLSAGTVRKPVTQEERLRAVSAFSNEICSAIAQLAPEPREREIERIAARFAEALPGAGKDLRETVTAAIDELADFARIIRIDLGQTQLGQQLKIFGDKHHGRAPGYDAAGDDGTEDGVIPGVTIPATRHAATDADDQPVDREAVLSAGIQDISNTLVEDFKLNDVLRMILETMYRAIGFKRVLLCIRDARSNTMQGRFGLGPDVGTLATKFRFPLGYTPDIFHVATSKGADILITDVNDAKIADRIPDWFRESVQSATFVLLPLSIKHKPVALIYGDKDLAGEIVFSERELSLLRTLRNQAVLAIKQAS